MSAREHRRRPWVGLQADMPCHRRPPWVGLQADMPSLETGVGLKADPQRRLR
jgi:hypothetical protein